MSFKVLRIGTDKMLVWRTEMCKGRTESISSSLGTQHKVLIDLLLRPAGKPMLFYWDHKAISLAEEGEYLLVQDPVWTPIPPDCESPRYAGFDGLDTNTCFVVTRLIQRAEKKETREGQVGCTEYSPIMEWFRVVQGSKPLKVYPVDPFKGPQIDDSVCIYLDSHVRLIGKRGH